MSRQDYVDDRKFEKSAKLFITNLPPNIPEDQLKKHIEPLFQTYGTIKSINVKKHKSGQYSYSFLQYEKIQDALKAIQEMDQKPVHDRPMKVRQDRQGDGCFHCNRSGHFAKQCPFKEYPGRDGRRRSRSRSSRSRSRSRSSRNRNRRDNQNRRPRRTQRERSRSRSRSQGSPPYRQSRGYRRSRSRDYSPDYHRRRQDYRRDRYRRSKSRQRSRSDSYDDRPHRRRDYGRDERRQDRQYKRRSRSPSYEQRRAR